MLRQQPAVTTPTVGDQEDNNTHHSTTFCWSTDLVGSCMDLRTTASKLKEGWPSSVDMEVLASALCQDA